MDGVDTPEYKRFVNTVARTAGTAENKLGADTTFESLRMDSLDLVEMMMDVEDEFSVEIADDTFVNVKTIGEAYTAFLPHLK